MIKQNHRWHILKCAEVHIKIIGTDKVFGFLFLFLSPILASFSMLSITDSQLSHNFAAKTLKVVTFSAILLPSVVRGPVPG